jgi:hypothetical protein
MAVAVAGTVLAATAAGGGGMTISARPLVVPSTISPRYVGLVVAGVVPSRAANQTVTVQANECTYPGWRDVATARTAAGGAWRVRFDANSSVARTKTTFRAKRRRAVSRTVVVQTRPGLDLAQLSARRRWTVGMLTERSFLDRKGEFQRFDRESGRWQTVKTFRFTEKMTVPPGAGGFAGAWSNASFRAQVARGTQVRAYVPRSQVRPCYLAAYSSIETAK